MSELGRSVVEAVEYVAAFHKDVAKLLGCVEDTLRGRGLDSSLWGATSVWDRSGAYHSPSGWIVRYLCRLYVPAPPENRKPEPQQKRWVYFIVYLTPRFVREPTAVWGVVTAVEAVHPWAIMKSTMLRDDGPAFLKTEIVSAWEPVIERPDSAESFVYRACPLVVLKDAAIVEDTVVNPLMELFQR